VLNTVLWTDFGNVILVYTRMSMWNAGTFQANYTVSHRWRLTSILITMINSNIIL